MDGGGRRTGLVAEPPPTPQGTPKPIAALKWPDFGPTFGPTEGPSRLGKSDWKSEKICNKLKFLKILLKQNIQNTIFKHIFKFKSFHMETLKTKL